MVVAMTIGPPTGSHFNWASRWAYPIADPHWTPRRTLTFGSTPFDVPSRMVPLTVNVRRTSVRWLTPLMFW